MSMLFLSDSILRKRRKFVQQVKRGTLTPEQVAMRVLEIEPFDHTALVSMGIACDDRGDDEQARAFYWRAIEANPAMADAYVLLAVSYRESDPDITNGLTTLAVLRALMARDEL